MVGKYCIVLDCGTSQSKCRGLSFHSLPDPNKSKEIDEWLQRLAVKIGLEHKFFSNPSKRSAIICSRHFMADCFETYGQKRRLKVLSMPTNYLPGKKHMTFSLARKPPTPRDPPPIPMIVKYFNFNEVVEAAKSLSLTNWYMKFGKDSIEFLYHQNFGKDQHILLEVTNNLKTFVFVRGKRLPYEESAVEVGGLQTTLLAIENSSFCQGIQDPILQDFVESRKTNSIVKELYYKEVKRLQKSREEYYNVSVVFATSCKMLAGNMDMCSKCKYVKHLLERKKDRANNVPAQMHPFTSLSKATTANLVNQLKQARQENKLLAKKNM